MAEWPNVPDSKSGVPQGTVGSNPTLSAKTISNWFQVVRTIYNLFGASLGALLEHLLDQTGFFIGLNVFEPVQNFPHDFQVLRPFADGAPALKACD